MIFMTYIFYGTPTKILCFISIILNFNPQNQRKVGEHQRCIEGFTMRNFMNWINLGKSSIWTGGQKNGQYNLKDLKKGNNKTSDNNHTGTSK